MRSCFLSIACLCAAAITSQGQDKSWPTSGIKLETVVTNAAIIAVAIANDTPSITKRVPLHINGVIKKGSKIIRVDRDVVSASCTQTFEIIKFIKGEGRATNRLVKYSFREKNNAFPDLLLDIEQAIPSGARVILLLDAKDNLLKVLPDNEGTLDALEEILKILRDQTGSQ